MPEVGVFYYRNNPKVAHEVSKLVGEHIIHIACGEYIKFKVKLETTVEVRERTFFMNLDSKLFVELEAWIKDNAFNRDNEVLKITVYKEGRGCKTLTHLGVL
jgi:hypothetical protein